MNDIDSKFIKFLHEEAENSLNYVQLVRNALAKKINVEDSLLDLYTLIVFTKGENATLEDIHNAWAIWRNNTNPTHKSLIPFDQLSRETQELDRKYKDAIVEIAKEYIHD